MVSIFEYGIYWIGLALIGIWVGAKLIVHFFRK